MEKRGTTKGSQGFYGRGRHGEGARVLKGGGDRWLEAMPCLREALPEEQGDLTGGSHLSAGDGGVPGIKSGGRKNGPWAILAAGLKWHPGAFSSFSYFSFSI
jgi:hypothetical protein